MDKLPENLPVYLIGAGYSGSICLTFYEPQERKLYAWYDDDHEPYCLTNLSPAELDTIQQLKKHPSLKRFELMEKHDALHDKNIWVTKVVAKDPLAIGSSKKKESIRDIIPEGWEGAKVWEARIVYDACYVYDKRLEMGMMYRLSNGQLIPIIHSQEGQSINEAEILEKTGVGKNGRRWVWLLEYPVPEFKRVALDIEVLGESKTRVPDTYKAEYPVISACLIGSDGKRRVLMLLRDGIEIGEETVDANLEFFNDELNLIKEIFDSIVEYPIVLTFNGDNFDMSYLYNRAMNLGMEKEDVAIQISRRKARVRGSIHIDLYRFFFNKSLQNYAFGGKYKTISLDAISRALLEEGKLHTDDDVWLATEMGKWSYSQLAKYNCQDGDLTLGLTSYDDSLVMKLIMVLMRISSMSMEDLIRSPISQWIRSMLFCEHRRRNYLIPNRDDIIALKGKTVTKAMIKGKKYKGGEVIKPVAGVHFDAKVMDFASLYPTLMKIKNLGYSTVRCLHGGCKDNLISGTTHWVCKKNRAMESELIGILRDLRVGHYKKLRKGNPWYSVVEQAIKVFLNASYGVFGRDSFDLYCPPVSESITAEGRYSIKETIKEAQRLEIEVLYGDTDSVFLKDPTQEQIVSLNKWSTENLDLDLDVDTEYRYVCLSSRKKNYMGVKLDGSIDIKGMSGKKKHIPLIIKGGFTVAKKYFAKAHTPEDIEAMKGALKKVVLQVYLRIKRRDFEMEEVAFHFTLGKALAAYEKTTPQHVKAARMLEDVGIFLKKGDRVSFVKCRGKGNVKPLQLATKKDVDIGKYHEILRSTFEQMLDPLGVNYDSIIGIMRMEDYQ